MDLKRCPKCGEEKPATTEFFHRHKQAKDGLKSWCKECNTAAAREYGRKNKEKVAEYHARYYQENRERLLPVFREYAKEHSAEAVERATRWYHENIERGRRNSRAAEARRRARIEGASGSHTADDIAAQYERQKGRCYWCQRKVGAEFDVDHVTPLSKGGSNGPENIVIACPSCNRRKGARTPTEFAGILC